MTGGTSPIGYLKAWHTNLYLSADADKVREALAEGEAAHDTDVLIRFLKKGLHFTVPHSPSLIRALNLITNRKLFLSVCSSIVT